MYTYVYIIHMLIYIYLCLYISEMNNRNDTKDKKEEL